MKFYQAGYYRLGKQGDGSGWTMVAPTEGMSRIAKEGFRGIAAKLVDLKNLRGASGGLPIVSTGVFQADRYFYIMHVNYAAIGEDARGVSYVHGYCFNQSEYYELCKNPDQIFGITEDNFDMEYQPSLSAYPMKESLAYEKMDLNALRQKYQLDDQAYRELILSAITAMEEYNPPLCIQTDCPADELVQTYKEVMYLILSMVPTHLRVKFTGFVSGGTKAKLFLSNNAEGSHVFRLESKESQTDFSRLSKYTFTRIYNAPLLSNTDHMLTALNNIDTFINETIENPLKNIGCEQLEAAYLNFFPEILSDGECDAVGILTSFLGFELRECDKVYIYLALLLKAVNDTGARIQDKKAINKLELYFREDVPEGFQEEYCRYLVRDIISMEPEEGYEKLYSYKKKSRQLYGKMYKAVQAVNPEFYERYIIQKVMPAELTSIEKIGNYALNPTAQYSEKVAGKLLQLLEEKAIEQFSNAGSISGMGKVLEQVLTIEQNLQSASASKERRFDENLYYHFWEQFDINTFEISDVSEYDEKYRVKDAARGVFANGASVNAQKVLQVMDFLENFVQSSDIGELKEILFTDHIFTSTHAKSEIQDVLQDNIRYILRDRSIAFDTTLAMFYDFGMNNFKVNKWVRALDEEGMLKEMFHPHILEKSLESSLLLREGKLYDNFFQNVEHLVKGKLVGNINQAKALKCCYDILCGKKVLDPYELIERQNFIFTIRKLLLGTLAVTSCILLDKALFSYVDVPVYVPIAFVAIEVILFILAWFLRIWFVGGIDGLLEETGLTPPSKWFIFIGITAVLAGLCVFTWVAHRILFLWITISILLIGSVAMAVYHYVIAEAEK